MRRNYIIDIPDFIESFWEYFTWRWKKSWMNYMLKCPFHSDNNPSFWISEKVAYEDWKFKCKWQCFSCHRAWITLESLLLRLWQDIDMEKWATLNQKSKMIKWIFWFTWDFMVLDTLKEWEKKKKIEFIDDSEFIDKYMTIEAHPYFIERWFSEDTWIDWNFWYSGELKRILFPLRNHVWKTLAYIWRSITKEIEPKYLYYWEWFSKSAWLVKKSDYLFWLDKIDKSIGSILIAEWPLNAIKIHQSWSKNAVAIMWSKISAKQFDMVKDDFNDYILWFDNDNAWKDWRKDFLTKIANYWNRFLKTVRVIVSDKDAWDLSENEVMELIKNAKEVDLDIYEKKKKKFKRFY